MNIEDRVNGHSQFVGTIPIGKCFKYNNGYYIRVNESQTGLCNITGINLSTGEGVNIMKSTVVYLVDATLVINKVGVIDDTSN